LVQLGMGFLARMKCPADLHIYDAEGRHVGLNYQTGEYENEIPGAQHVKIGEADYIFVPDSPGNYRIETMGKDAGTYSLDVVRPLVVRHGDGTFERVPAPFQYRDIPTEAGKYRTHQEDVIAIGKLASAKLGKMDVERALRAALAELETVATSTTSANAVAWDLIALGVLIGIGVVCLVTYSVVRRRIRV